MVAVENCTLNARLWWEASLLVCVNYSNSCSSLTFWVLRRPPVNFIIYYSFLFHTLLLHDSFYYLFIFQFLSLQLKFKPVVLPTKQNPSHANVCRTKILRWKLKIPIHQASLLLDSSINNSVLRYQSFNHRVTNKFPEFWEKLHLWTCVKIYYLCWSDSFQSFWLWIRKITQFEW